MRLCFDECVPPKWFRQLNQLLGARKQPIFGEHLLDHLKQGARDDDIVQWLTGFSPHMMMFSGDTGRNTRAGVPRLHLLCPANGVTSVFMTGKLCQREGFEKVRMVMVCLPDLIRAYDGPRGRRFKVEAHGDTYRLRQWDLPHQDPVDPRSTSGPQQGLWSP